MSTTDPNPPTPLHPTDLGQMLRDAREKNDWSLEEAAIQVRMRFPDWLGLKGSRIQRIEVASSAPADPIEVVILAETYGMDETIHDLIADQLRPIRDLLVRRIS